MEHELGVSFPDDYRLAILAVGLPHPKLALLNNIVEMNAALYDRSDIHCPEEIIATTAGWRESGMPKNLIAIGSDSGGSSFCFDEKDLKTGPVPSAPIYFWDHEFDETSKLETTFSAWIGSYLGAWSEGLSYKDF